MKLNMYFLALIAITVLQSLFTLKFNYVKSTSIGFSKIDTIKESNITFVCIVNV